MDIQNIIDEIKQDLTGKSEVRDRTLQRSRELISYCARATQATHRADRAEATRLLSAAQDIADVMIAEAHQYSDVYHAGYTQDALKELAEAYLTRAFILDDPIPSPGELGLENAAYLNGMAEAASELRRQVLDALRRGDIALSERLLALMDEVYTHLMTVDFPSAITGGLRRNTDMVRGVLERTRGDVTTAVRQEALKQALEAFERRVQPDT